jgi:pimeloyl-ACP methyl ester carboxylesterase
LINAFRAANLGILIAIAAVATAIAAPAPQSRIAELPGVRLHYLIAGKGDPVVLLHGYAETSRMWLPLIAKLADKHMVIAPDLRGFGDSSAPPDGYTKVAMARDIHALLQSLKIDRIGIVGHDIGLIVAYAYAAQYPAEVDRIVLMDAFLPGVGDWTHVWLLRDLWHFHFYGKTPLALVTGRERTYLEHFWNDFAADPKKSLPEADRVFYARPMQSRVTWRPAWRCFAPSSRTPRISPVWRKPRYRCRCWCCPAKRLAAIS